MRGRRPRRDTGGRGGRGPAGCKRTENKGLKKCLKLFHQFHYNKTYQEFDYNNLVITFTSATLHIHVFHLLS
jgi:hypothetical protein